MNPSNVLSLLRGPLAFLFLIDNIICRVIAIFLAMLTDSLDGYLARRFRMTSRLGATLDPLMDKFFVLFVIGVFIYEGKLHTWEALAFLSRDFAVLIFAIYLALKGTLSHFQIQSIWSGKVTTALQFFVLLGFTFNFSIPILVFYSFILLGILALIELYLIERQTLMR